MTPTSHPLRVAALVDLARTREAGGHVKCWERLAEAAAKSPLPLDLTVYFSGPAATERLGPRARLRQLPPVFSTSRLGFLPYVPDHSDLAPYHRRLARELAGYDLIHSTDGFFAFARTAEQTARRHGIPLVTSFHTDTPSYTRIFTRQTIERLFGEGWLARLLLEGRNMPEAQGRKMDQRLAEHVRHCNAAVVTRPEDHAMAEAILGKNRVGHLRLGVDKAQFGPHRADRAGVERDYGVAPGAFLVLFVGRLDVGKNIHTLIDAMARLRAEGRPVHLIAAGIGPAADDVRAALGDAASVPGFVDPVELARLYASVDVAALPSEVEMRGMVGVEAMASGCPALVSEAAGVAPLFANTRGMRPVASEAQAWAVALYDIFKDAAQRSAMRLSALAYSRQHLASWGEVLAEDLFAVWRNVVERQARLAAA
ncbi:MAG: glycosyltransferase [Caulobacterales bacterium]